VEVWPDNWTVIRVFNVMSTQWVVGACGPVGLNYAVLPEVWRRTKVSPADRDDVFEDLRVMEQSALQTIHDKGLSR
jgi:hypothetical protein